MSDEHIPDDRASDKLEAVRALDLVSKLFHQVNRVVPADQRLLTIPPEMAVRDAISLLQEHRFSQLPVVAGESVLGVFSFRSFAHKAAQLSASDIAKQKFAPGDLPVEDFVETFEFASVHDEMLNVFGAMENDNGILIGSHDKLIGILTPMDFLRYLYELAGPFVMLSEIELTLRELIRLAVSQEELEACAILSLENLYGPEKVPRTLETMTFDNYRMIISHSESWPRFQGLLGSNRTVVSGKLRELCELRNDVFHFKREITAADRETIKGHREWLLLHARKTEARRGGT
ncbi:CBS domain-containing protein [Paraburkholderia sediminicola]|uniref:CBS domain-containing protein n=1 Tax=Paraburkholderia sediminicola TaxID=458836 RepID=UPI0038BB8369